MVTNGVCLLSCTLLAASAAHELKCSSLLQLPKSKLSRPALDSAEGRSNEPSNRAAPLIKAGRTGKGQGAAPSSMPESAETRSVLDMANKTSNVTGVRPQGGNLPFVSQMPMKSFLLFVTLVPLSFLTFCTLFLSAYSKNQADGEETEPRDSDPLEENTYMMAIALLVRDLQRVAQGQGTIGLRTTRIMYALVLLFLTIFLQIALLACVKIYVTPQDVSSIREIYDTYEFTMYGSDKTHTTLTKYGNHRGIDGYFQPGNFNILDDETKDAVCNIPFAQVFFLELALFIWTVTCFAQFKVCIESFSSLIVMTPVLNSMAYALAAETNKDKTISHTIVGLTPFIRAFLVIGVYLPWFCTNVFLLWLGCRWLVATDDYGDMILNAVALEFVLKLKELLYLAMVAERSKRDLRNTLCIPPWKTERAGYWVFLNGLLWGYLAILWVLLYTFYLQNVLPDFKWDVREVCVRWQLGLLKDS
jgi:hypothetical protein